MTTECINDTLTICVAIITLIVAVYVIITGFTGWHYNREIKTLREEQENTRKVLELLIKNFKRGTKDDMPPTDELFSKGK